jgi:HAD superfamily hydrolase (TIGR01509 family)
VHVLPVSGHLPVERQPVTAGRLASVRAITFDFAGTLVRIDRSELHRAARVMAAEVAARLGPFDEEAFVAAWNEERERQFREDVPRFREVDLDERFARVLARMRGQPPPPADVPWDDDMAATLSDAAERRQAVDAYARAFVAVIPLDPAVEPLLAALARERTLGILSNWPLASAIESFVDAAGWRRHLSALVVSERVGTIKPHPAIFAAAEAALGVPDGAAILHVGDDWAADVVGAKRAGWRAAYLPDRTRDSPFPTSAPDGSVEADLILASLDDLRAAVGPR